MSRDLPPGETIPLPRPVQRCGSDVEVADAPEMPRGVVVLHAPSEVAVQRHGVQKTLERIARPGHFASELLARVLRGILEKVGLVVENDEARFIGPYRGDEVDAAGEETLKKPTALLTTVRKIGKEGCIRTGGLGLRHEGCDGDQIIVDASPALKRQGEAHLVRRGHPW